MATPARAAVIGDDARSNSRRTSTRANGSPSR
jgi:hypothetical protein